MWPSGSGEIQTSVQAGGIARALIRSSVSASVTGAPKGSSYRKRAPSRRREIPGPCGSLRVSPGTAASGPGGCGSVLIIHHPATSAVGGAPGLAPQSGGRGGAGRAQGLQQPVRSGQGGGYPAVIRRLEPGTGDDDDVRGWHWCAAPIAAPPAVDLPVVGRVPEQPPRPARSAEV